MSDDEKEVDLESSDDADKRAHHNALERKRRDHIKDSFSHLRDSIPSLQGEKNSKHKSGMEVKASRAQILNKATDYIQFMRKKNHTHQMDIDDLKRQNMILDQQVRALEKARTTGQFNADATAALLSTPDSLLSSSPNPESILDGLKDPNSPLDGLTIVKTENNNTDSASDEEYPSKTKRRKRDG